jgi:hypothetical protein
MFIGVSDRKGLKRADRVVCKDVQWDQLILDKVTFRASEK